MANTDIPFPLTLGKLETLELGGGGLDLKLCIHAMHIYEMVAIFYFFTYFMYNAFL